MELAKQSFRQFVFFNLGLKAKLTAAVWGRGEDNAEIYWIGTIIPPLFKKKK